MTDYTLGVLGGMGPEATSYFFQCLIKATPAKRDSDHIKTIIYSNPQIPDRTQAILGKGTSPIEEMTKTAQELAKLGVNGIFIPCITAHYFLEEVQRNIEIPILSLPEIVDQYLNKRYKEKKQIGVLCTTGTKNSGIFDRALSSFQLIYPEAYYQDKFVMEAIYGTAGIKAGYVSGEPSEKLSTAACHLKDNGAQVIVMGCTEIPLAFVEDSIDIPVINIMKVAAEHIIETVYK